MKKILILTVTVGEGHNSVAKALANEFLKNTENQVKVIDIFKKYGKSHKFSHVNNSYLASCKYALSLYNINTKMLNKIDPNKRNKSSIQSKVFYETPKLLQDIYLYEPDVIICTRFDPAIMLTNLRKRFNIPAKIITILTDFSVGPFWESAIGTDYLILPNAELKEGYIYKGYKSKQLLDYGIPTKSEFSEVINKKEARKKLGLDENLFTVFLMSGGGGFGKNPKLLNELLKVKIPLQILVVNGKDTSSKKNIELILKQKNKNHHIVKNYGFINFIAEAMSTADVYVGKCGGISVNEALNKKLPICSYKKLPLQESDNLNFLVKYGAGIILDKKHKLSTIIEELATDKVKIKKIISNIEKIRKPNATADLIKFANSFEKANYNNPKEITPKDFKSIYKEIKEILKEKPIKVKQKNLLQKK